MIYVSSAAIRCRDMVETVRRIASQGIRCIELSGGTEWRSFLKEGLLAVKMEYGLEYIIHNYFPPPIEPFVLNLSSSDDLIRRKSIEHCKNAIDMSFSLGGGKLAFHAGFCFDVPTDQIGRRIEKKQIMEREKALELFSQSWMEIQACASESSIQLYVENNVLSLENYKSFDCINPFLFTNLEEYRELRQYVDFRPLLDTAHLKVSSNSLNLDFEEQFAEIIKDTDYIHVSDNDGFSDTNQKVSESSIPYLPENITDVTVEVYTGLEDAKESVEIIMRMMRRD